MSTVFELDEAGWENRVRDESMAPQRVPEKEGPSFGERAAPATLQGIMRGFAGIGRAVAIGASAPFVLAEKSLGTEGIITDDYFRFVDENITSAVDFWTPDANTVGTAGRVLGGLAEIVGPLAATGGNPALLIGTQQIGMSADLVRQGVDPTTAQVVGGVQGLSTAVGFKIPMIGKTLGQRVMAGAVGNVGVNLPTVFAQRMALEANGYNELAEQYDPLDVEGRTVDLLIGAAFGFVPQGTAAPRMTPSAVNAVLAGANARHFQVDTAPGRPLDANASATHQRAMETALQQLLDGDPVSVSPEVFEANFEPRTARVEPDPEMVREVIGDIPEPRTREEELETVRTQARADAEAEAQFGRMPLVQEQTLRSMYKSAEAAKPLFDEQLTELAEAVGGTAKLTKLKGVKRAVEKITADYGGDATKIKDLLRATVEVKDLATATRAVDAIKGRFSVLDIGQRNLFDAAVMPPDGYRDAKFIVRMPNGAMAEIQVHLPQMLAAKKTAHPLYVKRTELVRKISSEKRDPTGQELAEIDELNAQMRDLYLVAWAEASGNSLANLSGETLDPLRSNESMENTRSEPSEPIARTETESPTGLTTTGTPSTSQSPTISDISVTPPERILAQPVTEEFLKKTIDIRDVPDIKKMSKDAGDYIERTEDSFDVPIARLEVSKAGRVADNSLKRFDAAAKGEIPKRKPVSVTVLPSGMFKVADGNGTVTAMKALGAKTVPVRIVDQTAKDTRTFVTTAAGRRLEVQPKLIELADAVTSDNPNFPKELQPRQRGARKALDQQVRDIAQNLDPARLGDSAEADRGAPITGKGNIVESGNGRVMALRYAYENLPEKAAEYRAFLEAQGYDTSGMKQPVLVRERVTELDDAGRQAFTVEANQAATAALSPVERAQADARLMDAATLSAMRGGDLTTVQNAGFVRAFLERLTGSERNAMLNPDGSISQEGVRRIQAALLAKAYGGRPESNITLGRMLESTDSDMRAALGALLDAAPAFARLRQAIADGKVPGEYDISGALTEAIENVAKLRLSGQSLRDFLAQGDMLTQRAPIVDSLMKSLYDKSGTRIAGREKIAATLTKYAGQASRQRLDQASLFAEEPVAVDKLVESTTAEPEQQAPKVTDMFGLKTPQGSMAVDAAKAALEVADIQVPTGAVDADGNPVIRSGRELMAEADAAIEKAEADAVGFDAAVSCILTRGLDDAA